MSSLDFANALFSKYQQTAASCSALLFTDSPTSPCPSSSVAPAVSSSCALVSSGYQLHVSGGKGSEGLPPSLSSPSSSSSSFPSTSSSSSFCLSLPGLNRSSGVTRPGAHPFNPAEMLAGGAYSASGAGPLCSSLQGCAMERFSGRPRLCTVSSRLPEPACRRQSIPEQHHHQQQQRQEGLPIYPWMRSSGEEREDGKVMRCDEIICEASQVSWREGVFVLKRVGILG